MAAVMVVRTGKRSSWRSRGRNQAGGSDETSDEDYKVDADGEEDEVSSEEEEVGEVEVSDEEEEEEETGSEESELEDEDEDFVINPVRKKRTPKARQVKKAERAPARKRRSGWLCEEAEEEKKGDLKAPRGGGVRKRRVFGGGDEDEEGDDRDDVDFSPEDEEDFDDEELEDEGEEEDVEEEEESNDEEDYRFVDVSVKRKNGYSGDGGTKRKRNVRKSKSGVKKRKRSKARSVAKKRRKAFVSSDDDDEDDEDFVVEEEEDEEEEDEAGRIRKSPRSSGGNATVRSRLLLPLAYDSPATDLGRRTARLVQRPRTGLCCRLRPQQQQQHKGKGKAGEEQQAQQDEEEDPPEKRICGVCLSEERKGHIIGVLNSCAHFFCFACILEWSKVESKCPVCKQRFTAVTKASGSDLAIQLRPIVVTVPKRDQVYQPSEEEVRGYLDPYANVVCIECQQGGEDTLMLLCDLCNSAAHTYCVGLGREVPDGDWYCEACRAAEYEPQDEEGRNQHQQAVLTGTGTGTGTGRVEIDMNVPYVPSPEAPEEGTTTPYFRTAADLTQPTTAQVVHHPQGYSPAAAARQPRSARQPASTVSERRALHHRIQFMYWLNVNPFRRQPGSEDRHQQQQQSIPFDDVNTALTRDFL